MENIESGSLKFSAKSCASNRKVAISSTLTRTEPTRTNTTSSNSFTIRTALKLYEQVRRDIFEALYISEIAGFTTVQI